MNNIEGAKAYKLFEWLIIIPDMRLFRHVYLQSHLTLTMLLSLLLFLHTHHIYCNPQQVEGIVLDAN